MPKLAMLGYVSPVSMLILGKLSRPRLRRQGVALDWRTLASRLRPGRRRLRDSRQLATKEGRVRHSAESPAPVGSLYRALGKIQSHVKPLYIVAELSGVPGRPSDKIW